MRVEQIKKIKRVALHNYDGANCEKAIYAKSDRRPGYRWYVGYGGDYLPASRDDISKLTEYSTAWDNDPISANYWVGRYVRMYR